MGFLWPCWPLLWSQVTGFVSRWTVQCAITSAGKISIGTSWWYVMIANATIPWNLCYNHQQSALTTVEDARLSQIKLNLLLGDFYFNSQVKVKADPEEESKREWKKEGRWMCPSFKWREQQDLRVFKLHWDGTDIPADMLWQHPSSR